MKRIIKELSPVVLMLVALILSVIVLPFGVLHTIAKPFYDKRDRPMKERFKYVGRWLLNVLYQLWVVVKYIMFQFSYVIDLFGNVVSGEMIEDIITHKEDTMLGNGDITISAAIGDIKKDNTVLNGRGLWLDKVLSKLDRAHKDHCGSAIKLWEFKRDLRNADK